MPSLVDEKLMCDESRDYIPFFKEWGKLIARSFVSCESPKSLDVALEKRSENSVTFRLRHNEDHAFLKLFDGIEDADSAYRRETRSIARFKDSGLVPRHLAQCDVARFVVTELTHGPTLATAIDDDNCHDYADLLGRWLADFDAVAPMRSQTGNWKVYLKKYDDLTLLQGDNAYADAIGDIPLCGQSLSTGDMALSNFIVDTPSRLSRVDFEHARFKPRGWDFIGAFEALAHRFPKQAESLLEAMSDGFRHGHKGALLVEELSLLARAVLCARVDAELRARKG